MGPECLPKRGCEDIDGEAILAALTLKGCCRLTCVYLLVFAEGRAGGGRRLLNCAAVSLLLLLSHMHDS